VGLWDSRQALVSVSVDGLVAFESQRLEAGGWVTDRGLETADWFLLNAGRTLKESVRPGLPA
jgi:hypothetical protein